MRKIKEVLRLKYGLGLKNREIARSCSCASPNSISAKNEDLEIDISAERPASENEEIC